MAQVDFFLKIEGADFDSQSPINIESFSWGATNAGSGAFGSGGGAGKVSVHDISIVKVIDKTSPVLFGACCGGKHLASATLYIRKAGSSSPDLHIKLLDCLVSSVQMGGNHHANSVGIEQISINFAKIEYNYKPNTADLDRTTGQVTFFVDSVGPT